jgi:tetratricopeptide (TPR) repeat protein
MIEKFPENSSFNFGLSNVYNNQGQLDNARAEYEIIAIRSQLNREEAFRELALIHFAEGNNEKCKEYISKIKIANRDVVLRAIEIWMSSDEMKITRLEELLKENQEYLKLYIFLGKSY